jgi:hypothetical protein
MSSQLLQIDPATLQALREIVGRSTSDPVPLAQWRREVEAHFRKFRPSYRCRMNQAVRLACELAETSSEPGTAPTTAQITPELVDRLAARPGKASTVNGLLGALRTALKFAAKRGWVAQDLVGRCRWRIPERDGGPPRFHTRAAILRVCRPATQ